MFSDESVELVLYFIAKLITIDKRITCSLFVVSKKPQNYESLNPAFACFGYSFLEIERAVERSIIIKIYKARLKKVSAL